MENPISIRNFLFWQELNLSFSGTNNSQLDNVLEIKRRSWDGTWKL